MRPGRRPKVHAGRLSPLVGSWSGPATSFYELGSSQERKSRVIRPVSDAPGTFESVSAASPNATARGSNRNDPVGSRSDTPKSGAPWHHPRCRMGLRVRLVLHHRRAGRGAPQAVRHETRPRYYRVMYADGLSFLEEERDAWRPFEALLNLSDEQLERSVDGAHGWSGRDLMAHLAVWIEWMLNVSRELALGPASPTYEGFRAITGDWEARAISDRVGGAANGRSSAPLLHDSGRTAWLPDRCARDALAQGSGSPPLVARQHDRALRRA